jgi:hypothetical protein
MPAPQPEKQAMLSASHRLGAAVAFIPRRCMGLQGSRNARNEARRRRWRSFRDRAANTSAIPRRLFGRSLSALVTLQATLGLAQEAPNGAPIGGQDAPAQDQGAGPEGDVLSAQRLFQLMYQVKTAPGTDLNGNPVTTTTDTWKLRRDLTLPLSSQWDLALRADLPFVAKDKYTDSNPNGDFLYGLGDADVQAALIDNINERWKAGAGARLIMPTGDSTLGSGKWQIMPILGARYELPEISKGSYFEPLARWDYSFAGDPTKKNINNLQLAPMLNISLRDRWFFTLYPNPEIRWNFGDPITGQTGRLFFPFDARIGRKFSDLLNVSLEVSVPIIKQYPVYDFMTALRLNLTF